jgi:uncharacterized protein YjiK
MPASLLFRPLLVLLALVGFPQAERPEVVIRCPLNRDPVAQWKLPDNLKEISGLARTSQGRLLAHGDEKGRIFTLDEQTGKVVATWELQGEPRDDFEGIAVAGKTVYLMTGAGRIYTTREGRNGEKVSYTKIDTGLGKQCEFEGLAYDPKAKVLLLPCKTAIARELASDVVVFRWSVEKKELAEPASFRFPRKDVGDSMDFRATSVEVDPKSGHLILLSSKRQMLVELSAEGRFLGVVPLETLWHRQPEGLTLGPDRLYISDEGRKHTGMLTSYACAK